ncbi:PaaI family thioesterase [Calidifontibacillus erzurumensis]|uniref:PaaI family thioesterase n=1 Tax=Calidifontibacillus erzurumensis TaxID=2741433 RepID=A0A8J8GCD7_9BACI|nr:PaaI family thioesterase [Calidifontibacillus erzurumensis]NSL50939.1 PaaI family thioesterase [Calidifontibacillus erzurumensis]
MNKTALHEKFSKAADQCESDYEKYFLAKLFDLQFTYTDDTCTVEFEVEDFMHNPHNVLHGGVIGFVFDVSMGHLCKKVIGPSVTVEMKVQYFKSVKSGKVQCVAKFLRKGRNILFLESRMYDCEGNLIAMATGTFARIKE